MTQASFALIVLPFIDKALSLSCTSQSEIVQKKPQKTTLKSDSMLQADNLWSYQGQWYSYTLVIEMDSFIWTNRRKIDMKMSKMDDFGNFYMFFFLFNF